MRKLWRESKGSASIIEYSIILPLCLWVLVFLFMAGYVLHQRAVLESAAQRAVMIVQKLYADPNYRNLVLLTDQEADRDYVGYKERQNQNIADLERDPYRYWNNGYREDIIQQAMDVKIRNIIYRNQLIDLSSISVYEIQIESPDMTGMIFKNKKVVVKQEISVPILEGFHISPKVTLEGHADITVTQPAELIRNSHFAINVVEDLTAGTPVEDIIEKIGVYMDKITEFFSETGGTGG